MPKVLQGLSPNITSLFKAPGMTRVERLRAAELALQESEDTADLSDDQAVLTYQLGAGRARKQTIQKELARLNKRLRGRLTKKQRKAIFAKRSSLVEELGEVQGQISGAREGLQGLGEGEFGEDPQTAAIERQTEAIEKAREVEEERIRLEEEHKQAIEALQKEMALNRKIAESEIATSGAVARRALADIIAGQLGPRAFHRAQTAGAGSVGGY